jgi:hypothetical protein
MPLGVGGTARLLSPPLPTWLLLEVWVLPCLLLIPGCLESSEFDLEPPLPCLQPNVYNDGRKGRR